MAHRGHDVKKVAVQRADRVRCFEITGGSDMIAVVGDPVSVRPICILRTWNP